MGKYNRGIYITLIVFVFILGLLQGQATVANAVMNNSQEIPDESIRLRILANSNASVDQKIKRLIRDEVNQNVTQWVGELESLEQAREIIKDRLPDIENTVATKLKEYNIDEDFSVTFGDVFFPTKLYGEYVYPAGEYEAILITIGDGQGENWWCVLFPPLCFLDFENGDAVKKNDSNASKDIGFDTSEKNEKNTQSEEIEVKFFLIEWAVKLIDNIKSFV
jgi:stage II sporulation protein R